ncbi:MAG: class I SAM-dependent methyltransferase [Candidatus Wallbacteria bacterium]|nr:class I SAM-dependent methyltransferase [Candidatus Wallbacteria bacterium]
MKIKDNFIAPRKVRLCYSITGISSLAGIEDYTEGIYNGNPDEDYCIAQKRQHEYLLDELGAGPGFKLLEVGCGLGTLLKVARGRGVNATGITISEDQWIRCRAQGLEVLLVNYKNLPSDWKGRFDGIIANGALEHFCQPEDAAAGLQDSIYQSMFRIFFSLLNPASACRKLVTTAIHFRGIPVPPEKFLNNPLLQIFDKTGLNFSILHRGYGGYYPKEGQLKHCASGVFDMLHEADGTLDYRFTTEEWYRKFSRVYLHNLRFNKALFRHFMLNPIHTLWFMASFIGPASQLWQFRGDPPPVLHLRHTWQAV